MILLDIFPITNDAVIFGILMLLLGLIFTTARSQLPFWAKFYTYVPALLLCYFLPSMLTTSFFGATPLVDTGGAEDAHNSQLYFVASRYLLPAALVLLTLSIDIKGIRRLGPKAIIMFLTGTVGVMIGGPLTLLLFQGIAPAIVAPIDGEPIWRGLTTVAGSWIGGGANQTAMKEVFGVGPKLFSAMVTVDILVANVWMAFLLYGAARHERIDRRLRADNSAITSLRDKVHAYRASILRIPTLTDSIQILAVAFGFVALAHLLANILGPAAAQSETLKQFNLDSTFFWIVVIATTGGLGASFTRLRTLEGVGASRFGSLFIYILVATIGLKMDVTAIFAEWELFAVGAVWMLIHVGLMLLVAVLIKAPLFFVAVGSKANIGGAASAPVVAAAFDEALAPVGVLLAVLGYALGTYGAYLCGLMMQAVST
jgi:uncharacterized membrane protein